MTKSLFMLILVLHSCDSTNNNTGIQQDTIKHVKIEQPQTIIISKIKTVDSSFLSFWKEFMDAVKGKNQNTLTKMSFDSLACEHKNVSINKFIKSYFTKVFDDTLLNKLSESNKVEFIDEKVITSYMPVFVLKQVSKGEFIMKKKVNITKIDKYPDGPLTIVLEFIETKNGYKFYGYDKFG